MKLLVERQPASQVVLDITADEEEFAKSMQRAFRRVSKDIQIPGFRPGKAPRGIVERHYGREIFLQEAADDIMEPLYRQALEQEELTPLGEPDVEIVAVEPVNFRVTLQVYPSIEPGDYATVRAEPEDAAITEDEVDEVLDRMRKSQAEWVEPGEARTPREGDQVTVDYEVREGDEEFQEPVTDAEFVLGETNLLEQLRERIEDMHVGDTETFELAFDEEDATADPSIRGKALTYTVTLKDLKERKLPELNDELAQEVAEAASFDDLMQQIRDDLHQGKTSEARTNVLNRIIDTMAEGAEVDPPAVMIDEEVDRQRNQLQEELSRNNTSWEAYLRTRGKTEDEIRTELRPEAARRVRNSLVVQEIGRREEVAVADADIDAELERMVGPMISGEDDEQQQRMNEIYRSDYFRNMVRSNLFEQKLTDRLIEIATEGRGAVVNGWEPPEPSESEETEGAADEGGTAGAVSAAQVADQAEAAPTESGADDEGTGQNQTPPEAIPTDESEASEREQVRLAEHQASTGMATDSVETAASAGPGTTAATGVEAAGAGDIDKAAEAFPSLEGESGEGWVKGHGETAAPEGYPIKGNADSRIYHPPQSRFYDNTAAEYFFASPEVAEEFGFRPPKGIKPADEGDDE